MRDRTEANPNELNQDDARYGFRWCHLVFFFQAEDGIRDVAVTGVQTCALPILSGHLGYIAEDPATLEEKFAATNSGRLESLSFVAPAAYLLELLVLWTDTSRVLKIGRASCRERV